MIGKDCQGWLFQMKRRHRRQLIQGRERFLFVPGVHGAVGVFEGRTPPDFRKWEPPRLS